MAPQALSLTKGSIRDKKWCRSVTIWVNKSFGNSRQVSWTSAWAALLLPGHSWHLPTALPCAVCGASIGHCWPLSSILSHGLTCQILGYRGTKPTVKSHFQFWKSSWNEAPVFQAAKPWPWLPVNVCLSSVCSAHVHEAQPQWLPSYGL